MFFNVYIGVIQLQSVSFLIYHNKLLLKNIIKLQWFSILGEKNYSFLQEIQNGAKKVFWIKKKT